MTCSTLNPRAIAALAKMGVRVEQHADTTAIAVSNTPAGDEHTERSKAAKAAEASQPAMAAVEGLLPPLPLWKDEPALTIEAAPVYGCVIIAGVRHQLENSKDALILDPIPGFDGNGTKPLKRREYGWDCHVVGRLTVDRRKARMLVLLKQYSVDAEKTPGTQKRRERRASALRHGNSNTLRRHELIIEICKGPYRQVLLHDLIEQLLEQGTPVTATAAH